MDPAGALPREICVAILSRARLRDVAAWARASRAWAALCRDEGLWLAVLQRLFVPAPLSIQQRCEELPDQFMHRTSAREKVRRLHFMWRRRVSESSLCNEVSLLLLWTAAPLGGTLDEDAHKERVACLRSAPNDPVTRDKVLACVLVRLFHRLFPGLPDSGDGAKRLFAEEEWWRLGPVYWRFVPRSLDGLARRICAWLAEARDTRYEDAAGMSFLTYRSRPVEVRADEEGAYVHDARYRPESRDAAAMPLALAEARANEADDVWWLVPDWRAVASPLSPWTLHVVRHLPPCDALGMPAHWRVPMYRT